MANILQLEQEIINRLKQSIDKVNVSIATDRQIRADVEELPLDPAEIGKPVTATQIWVAFRSEKFDSPPLGGVSNPRKPPTQSRTITFELIVRSQQLRVKGHQRVYPILDVCRDALSGWMPKVIHTTNGLTKPFYPVESGFTNMGAGLWVYSMTFACTALYSPPIQEV